MKYDTALEIIGGFGNYQRILSFFVLLPIVFTSMNFISWIFIGALPNYRCQLPFENDSYTVPDEFLQYYIPKDEDSGKWSNCLMYNISNENSTNLPLISDNSTLLCTSWKYDRTLFKTSLVMEWNLVCHNNWFRALLQASYMIGVFISNMTVGSLSDRWGRRKIYLISILLMALTNSITALVVDPYVFFVFRMFAGLFAAAIIMSSFILVIEMVGVPYRVAVGIFCQLFYAAAYFFNPLIAYFVHDWKHIQLTLSVPIFGFCVYWWFIPESPRWLLIAGKKKEAISIINNMAKRNKTSISEDMLECLSENSDDKNRKGSFYELIRTNYIRKISLNMFFQWIINTMVYYGLTLTSIDIGSNDFINSLIGGAIEIPAYVICLFMLNHLGRRISLCCCEGVAGITFFITLAVPHDMIELKIFLTMLGKTAIIISFTTLYVYGAELFPTIIRNTGLSVSSCFGRIGGVAASFVIVLADYYHNLPMIIYGILAILGSGFSLFFPETLNKNLEDTIDQTSRRGSNVIPSNN